MTYPQPGTFDFKYSWIRYFVQGRSVGYRDGIISHPGLLAGAA